MHMLKRATLVLLAVFFVGFEIMANVIVSVPVARAAVLPFEEDSQARSHEVVTAFIEFCAGGALAKSADVKMASVIRLNDARNGNWYLGKDARSPGQYSEYTEAPGPGLKAVTMSFLNADRERSCRTLGIQAAKILDDSTSDSVEPFLNHFYSLDGDTYKLKSEFATRILPELRRMAVAKGYYGENYTPSDALNLRFKIFRPLFEQCFRPLTNQTDPLYIVTAPSTIAGVPGAKYEIVPGRENNQLSLGSFYGSSLSAAGFREYGQGDDEPQLRTNSSCSILALRMQAKPDYFREVFAASPGRLDKYSDLVNLLNQNQDTALYCIQASPKTAPAFKNLANTSLAGAITILSTGLLNHILAAGLTEEGLNEILFCMMGESSPIRDELAAILGRDVDDPTAGTPVDPTDTAEDDIADDCDVFRTGSIIDRLKSPLDWLGCAIADGLFNFITWSGGIIDDLLATDFDQATQDSLKPVWESFITIANVLFVIGFLAMIISQVLAGRW